MIAIVHGKIVTPEDIIEDRVLHVKDGRIQAIADDVSGADRVINAHGRYVMPGFVDIHSDSVEQLIRPRPTSHMDFELALKECERELLLRGITTIYHSISLYKNEFFGTSPLRTKDSVQKLSELIASIHERYHLIHHRFHLRIEIDNLEAFDIAEEMITAERVHMISFTDHTPGQGQYKDLAVYADALTKYHGKEIDTVGLDGILAYHKLKQTLSFEQLKALAELAHVHGIPVASHDDDTPEKLAVNRALGVDISEFPTSLDIARAARAAGFFTVVGAPNILRGNSHAGNMSAAEAVRDGCANALCSDYYPAAILHSIFSMHNQQGMPLCEMVAKATLGPAQAAQIDREFGSIEVGKRADLLIVDTLDGYPVITHVLVDGNPTARVEYRR